MLALDNNLQEGPNALKEENDRLMIIYDSLLQLYVL